MSAFRKAYELGADGFETDVQLTKDGELVICHNYSIDGLSDGKGLIRELTLEELRQYDFGVTYGDGTEFAGERISTLAEVLEECKDFDINESFRTVNEQLISISKGLGEMQSVASTVTDLKKVLSNVKTRGNFGEVQLEAILQDILTPDQYVKQADIIGN